MFPNTISHQILHLILNNNLNLARWWMLLSGFSNEELKPNEVRRLIEVTYLEKDGRMPDL
jgi:hypothetical protein